MKTLSLKKYQKPGAMAGKKKTNPGKEFFEFYIDSEPLSVLLDQFYGSRNGVLDNWTGVFGRWNNHSAELIKVYQLLGKSISNDDIRKICPPDMSGEDISDYIKQVRDEFADPEVIIYCCAECGDYGCGGVTATINKTDNSFTWTFAGEERKVVFEFDKYQYFSLFNNYARQLEKKLH